MPGPRILFVDDDFISNMATCEVLRADGFNVTEAYCASAAMKLLNKRHVLSALVTDVDLGPGPDGFAVARCARAAYPDLPVVFISGTAMSRHLFEGVGGSQFIAKPLNPRQIVEALHRALPLEAA
jgi:CheY-like chemotaxis protein